VALPDAITEIRDLDRLAEAAVLQIIFLMVRTPQNQTGVVSEIGSRGTIALDQQQAGWTKNFVLATPEKLPFKHFGLFRS
jgi:hypothetical protein